MWRIPKPQLLLVLALVVVFVLMLALWVRKKGARADVSSGKESAAFVLAYMKAANAKDAAQLRTFYDENVVAEYVDYIPPSRTEGREKLVDDTFKEFWKAFPDARFEPMRVLANGRELVLISLAMGTNTGEIQGMPPTEELIGILSGYHWKLDDKGKIQVETVYMDQSALPGQLGLLPEGQPFRPLTENTESSPKVVIAENTEEERKNLELIKSLHAALNRHDLDQALSFYKDSAVYSYVPSPKDYKDKKSIAKALAEYLAMSSDIKVTHEWIWSAGDYVATRAIVTGTNDGPLPGGGGDATNKPFKSIELEIYKITNGQITRQWTFANGMAMAVQLGLAQSPE